MEREAFDRSHNDKDGLMRILCAHALIDPCDVSAAQGGLRVAAPGKGASRVALGQSKARYLIPTNLSVLNSSSHCRAYPLVDDMKRTPPRRTNLGLASRPSVP
jgi:hypothetical protein